MHRYDVLDPQAAGLSTLGVLRFRRNRMRSVFDALKGKTPPGGPARTPPDSGPKGYHEPYDLPPGSAIANYRIIGKLGEGGMGTVYLAEHPQISRRAAIKVLHREYSQDPLFADRFLNEARAVNLIAHPGLVEIFEYGALPDGTKYIVMEYLEGELLTALLDRGRQQQRRLGGFGLALARQVALALDAAHEKGIVHRGM